MGKFPLTIVRTVVIIAIITVTLVAGCTKAVHTVTPDSTQTPATAPAPASKTVTDQAGRTVVLPYTVNKVVAVGAVPPINSFIQAIGEGDTIAEGVPASFDKSQWRYQFEITPNIANLPVLQSSMTTPDNEAIMKVDPDVIFTTTPSMVSNLQITGIPVVCFSANTGSDVKDYMTLLGQVYNSPDKAKAYNQYLDDKISYVNEIVSSVPEDQRPTVLYMTDPKTLHVPNAVCEEWIRVAGGISVSALEHVGGNYQFNMEQLIRWNPDIIIVRYPDLLGDFYNDSRFSNLKAVKNKQIYSTPAGVQIWAGGTPEYPMMVQWAAKLFYPDRFKDLDMQKETVDFYAKFFNWNITPERAQVILDGRILNESFKE